MIYLRAELSGEINKREFISKGTHQPVGFLRLQRGQASSKLTLSAYKVLRTEETNWLVLI